MTDTLEIEYRPQGTERAIYRFLYHFRPYQIADNVVKVYGGEVGPADEHGFGSGTVRVINEKVWNDADVDKDGGRYIVALSDSSTDHPEFTLNL